MRMIIKLTRSWLIIVLLVLVFSLFTFMSKEIDIGEAADTANRPRKRQLLRESEVSRVSQGARQMPNRGTNKLDQRKRSKVGRVAKQKKPNSGPSASISTESSSNRGYSLNDDEMKTLNSIIEYIGQSTLKKTVFSHTKRLLFVVGLEGSGHHMAAALMEQCRVYATKNLKLQNLCTKEDIIPELLFRVVRNRHVSASGVRTDKHYGLFGSSGYINHGKYIVEVHKRMLELANKFNNDSLSAGPIFMHINGKDSPVHGMLSYPNYDGVNRNLHNPDLHVLAAVAECAGVDLRLLVLQRSAKELYGSASARFALPSALMGMSNSASNLFSQLTRVDPSFFACVQYHDFSKLQQGSQLDKLAAFLHPFFAENDAEVFKFMISVVRDHVRSEETILNSTHISPSVDTLNEFVIVPGSTILYHQAIYQGRIQMIDNLCAKSENSVYSEN